MSYSPRFKQAVDYAIDLHADQHRKATSIPYVTHLMSVAALVAEYGGTEDQVIAALLHDAVEDQGGAPRLEDVRRRFGQPVADIVQACTDTDQTPKPPWRERKEDYIAHLSHASPDVLLVSAADKLHNSRTIVADLRERGPDAFEIFTGRRDGTLWYYRSLVEVFESRFEGPIVAELARTVRQMHELADAD